MKVYTVMIGGLPHTMQFPEGEQPEGAVEVKQVEKKSAEKPANKGRKPANKSE